MVEPIFSTALMSISGITLLILLAVFFFVIVKLRGKDDKSLRYVVTTAIGGGIGVSLFLTFISIFVYLIKGQYLAPWFYSGNNAVIDKYLLVEVVGYFRRYQILIRWDLDVAILFIIGFSLIFALILIIASKISKK